MTTIRQALAACAFALGGAAAQAQENSAAELALEEIVVTARKATENLQTVPIAIAAFTAKDIEAAGIRDLGDVASQTPGLVFDTVIGEHLAIPTIRGLTQNDLFGDVNNVEIFLDGVNVSGRAGLNFSLLDIERIEVVKGPQSALYGRNSFAGAINFVTRRAPDSFEGQASATAGSQGTYRGMLSFGGALTDTLRGRLALAYDETQGSYRNRTSPGDTLGGHEYRSVSGGLDWTPTDTFGLRLNAYYSDDDVGPPAVGYVVQNCEPNASGQMQAYCGELPEADESALGADTRGYGERREIFRTSLQADWQTGIGQLTSLTGYSTLRHEGLADVTRTVGPASWFYLGTLPGGGTAPQVFQSKLFRGDLNDVDEFSQELRLSSAEDQRLRWIAGLYYYRQDYTGGLDAGALSALPANFVSFVPGFYTAIARPWFVTDRVPPFSRFERETASRAVFGALEFDFTDSLRGRVEGRYTQEEKAQSTPIRDGRVIAGAREFSDTWSFFTPRFTLDYRTGAGWMVYGSAAKGVKAGGFNENATVADEESFGPEENWTYELGTKAMLLGSRLSVDVSVYYVDWSDMQLPGLSPGASIPQTVTLNVGTATSQGAEIALQAAVTPRLTASLGFAYTDAKYDEARNRSLIGLPSFAASGGNISGFEMPRTPRQQWNAALNYRRPAFGAFDVFTRLDYSYKSSQKPMSDGLTYTDAIERLNARIGLESDRWRLELWGTNLTDDATPAGAFRDAWLNNFVDGRPALFLNRTSTSYPRLMSYGATATLRF